MMFLLVHSKSKASIKRLAQAAVLELLAPRVDEPALRAGRRVVGQYVALDAAVLEGGKVVARRPGARGELLAEQIILGGEAFEADLAVAVIFVAHDVEIVLPARHRQIGAPPVLHALEFDEMARPRSGRLCRRRCRAEYPASTGRTAAWNNRPARRSAGRRRTAARRAPRLSRKAHHHGALVGRLGAFEVAQQLRDDRMALVLQRRQRPRHVVRGERRAVVEFRFGRSVKR